MARQVNWGVFTPDETRAAIVEGLRLLTSEDGADAVMQYLNSDDDAREMVMDTLETMRQ